ncbi:MAG: hypothetical protein CM15mP127_14540 [Gammaproteobacteria bacterium]|nr:MAG: hypothetical protein CM15mP127_14540 [Gammaproteobacteria bacterium]
MNMDPRIASQDSSKAFERKIVVSVKGPKGGYKISRIQISEYDKIF